MFWQKSSEACAATPVGGRSPGRVEGLDPSGLRGDPDEPSTYHYRGKRRSQAALIGRIKEIAATRVRYGYRRIHVLVRREGWHVNAKRIYRLYRDLGLQLRNKVPKRRVKAKLRDDRRPAERANETWAMDFVRDQLATGRKIRVLTIVDTFTR
jgi:putative transposase